MSILLEDQLPGVMANGLVTAKDATFSGNLTVTGTTNIGTISLSDLTTTGNTILGNASTDTLTVNGNATLTGTAAGTMLDIVATATTTGIGVDLTGNTALTTGQLLTLASSATAIATTGRLFLSTHSGATGTSAILNEFASAANDETEIVKITASAALAAGKALNISVAALTTGSALNISDANAMTTGNVVVVASNSADTGTRSVVQIKQDHASASGATALEVWQDGALAAIKLTGNPTIGIDLTVMANTEQSINFTAGTGSTAAPQTNAPIGFIKVGVAGTNQWIPYYDAT